MSSKSGRRDDDELRLNPHGEVIGGVVLLAAAVAAVVWANLAPQTYLVTWRHSTPTRLGPLLFPGDVRTLLSQGAMAVFFLAIGLELGRELATGELADRRTAALPIGGALGGMVGAAAVYLAVAHSASAARGFGIPMATDVAFALGALALFGRRVPRSLIVFVLALAVADDLGSVIVLAVGYSGHLDMLRVSAALACVLVLVILRRRHVAGSWPYLIAGAACWEALVGSGVEPVLAGVATGLAILVGPVARRLEQLVAPIAAFVVLPAFALANAGVRLDWHALSSPGAFPVLSGVLAARVVGKLVGIVAGVALAARLVRRTLPSGIRHGHLVGAGLVCGIGFTVPLLFADAAFPGAPDRLAAAQVGLYAGSLLAFSAGAVVLTVTARRTARGLGGAPMAEGGLGAR